MFPESTILSALFNDFNLLTDFENEPSCNTPMEPNGENVWIDVYDYWKEYLVPDVSNEKVRIYMVPQTFDILGMYEDISISLGNDVVYDWRQNVLDIVINTGIRRFPKTHVTDLQMLTSDGDFVCYNCFLTLREDTIYDFNVFRENHWSTDQEEIMMLGLCAFCENCRTETMRQVV